MTVEWNDLVEYYGQDINVHRDQLSKAHQATFAMLACKWSKTDPARITNRSGDHAEERLLDSDIWRTDIPEILDSRSDLDTAPLIVTIALNRSPCGHCAWTLANALQRLQFNFARRFENAVFILASLGYYQSGRYMSEGVAQRHPVSNKPLWVTTHAGLSRLNRVGWRLQTLSFDGVTTNRGLELTDWLERNAG